MACSFAAAAAAAKGKCAEDMATIGGLAAGGGLSASAKRGR